MSVQSHSSETRPHRLSHLAQAALIALALMAFTALIVGARGWLAPHSLARSAIMTASENPQQRLKQRSQMEVEIVTITPLGVEPAQITRPAGKFLLVVNNQTDFPDLTFHVEREGGGRLREVRMPRENPDWNGEIDAHPGAYVITEANHPECTCRVTITAQ